MVSLLLPARVRTLPVLSTTKVCPAVLVAAKRIAPLFKVTGCSERAGGEILPYGEQRAAGDLEVRTEREGGGRVRQREVARTTLGDRGRPAPVREGTKDESTVSDVDGVIARAAGQIGRRESQCADILSQRAVARDVQRLTGGRDGQGTHIGKLGALDIERRTHRHVHGIAVSAIEVVGARILLGIVVTTPPGGV